MTAGVLAAELAELAAQASQRASADLMRDRELLAGYEHSLAHFDAWSYLGPSVAIFRARVADKVRRADRLATVAHAAHAAMMRLDAS